MDRLKTHGKALRARTLPKSSQYTNTTEDVEPNCEDSGSGNGYKGLIKTMVCVIAAVFVPACVCFGLQRVDGDAVTDTIADSMETELVMADSIVLTEPDRREFDWKSLCRFENLALACVRDGEYYYYPYDNWEKIPDEEKDRFTKKGVVVIGNGERFIWDLYDSGSNMTYDEAMRRFGDRLPTENQADVMVNNYESINAAIVAFGGDNPMQYYWTVCEDTDFYTTTFSMQTAITDIDYLSETYGVRAVSPVPAGVFVKEKSKSELEWMESCWMSLSRFENLALACVRDGEYYYYPHENWEKIPYREKHRFTKKGVVVVGNGKKFILDLRASSSCMTWDEAMSRYGNRLPTKSQAEVMGSNRDVISAAIKAFGGDKDSKHVYWTRTELDSSYAWYGSMLLGDNAKYALKSDINKVRGVASVPVDVFAMEEPKPEPVRQEFDWKSLSRLENLALACVHNGEYYYYTQASWEKFPAEEKDRFIKKGVVVIDNGEQFILELYDSGGLCLSWDDAVSWYGSRLPTKSQAEIMGNNYEAINAAIAAFGGNTYPVKKYWTRTECTDNSSKAWFVLMFNGTIGSTEKTYKYWLRTVDPVPVTPAE